MIKIMNCNNIDSGEITVFENQLNIKYGFNGTEPQNLSCFEKSIFTLIKPLLDKNQERMKKNISNGLKGGRPRKSKQNPNETETKPKQNPNETEMKPNDNLESYIDKDKEIDKDKDKDKDLD